jgi:hypothetical protein
MFEKTYCSPSSVKRLSATRVLGFRLTSRFNALDADCAVSVSPFRCRARALHGYPEEYLTEKLPRDEIARAARHAQLLPTLPSFPDDPEDDVGIVSGARRLLVARRLSGVLQLELWETSMSMATQPRCTDSS